MVRSKAVGPRQATGVARDLQLKKREAQNRALELYSQGLTVEQAMAAVGRKPHTWEMWRDREPWFAAKTLAIAGRDRAAPAPFPQFRRSMFGFDTFWHQQRMVDAIEGAKGGAITLVLLPPFWGKSTLVEDWICYVLGVQDPNHRFAIISEGQYQARKMVRRIQQRMTDEDSAYVQRYGPFRATDRSEQKPWNADFFSIIRSSADERDYSLEARGAGAKIYGSRWDTVILDDIQSTKNVNQTDQLLEYFRQDVITRPGLAGRIIIVGTRVGPGDFYERLLEEEMVDDLVQIPALDDDGRSMFPAVFDSKGKRVFAGRDPLGWSEDELAVRREKVGEETWARVYMQQPQSKAGAPFTEEAIRRCLDPRRRIGDSNPAMAVMCSIDPALTGHASLKACGYDAERMYLLDTENVVAPGRYEELYALVEKMAAKWQPGEFIFEVNAMQKGLARDDRLREMSERLGFRIVEHTTRQNKMDTAIGVAAMADGFRRGEVVLPDGDDATKRQLTLLVTELRRWRPDIPTRLLRQDEVMSLWFCYLRWRQLRDHLTSSGSGLRIGGMGWTPTPYGRVA